MGTAPQECGYEDDVFQNNHLPPDTEGSRTHIGQGCLGRLLHHISHLTCQLQITLSRHHLQLQSEVCRRLRWSMPVRGQFLPHPLIGILKVTRSLPRYFSRPDSVTRIAFLFVFQKFSCSLSADVSNPALQVSNTGLSGVIVNDLL